MPSRHNLTPPKETTSDKFLALIRAASSIAPPVGVALESILALVGTSIESRKQRWAERIVEEIKNMPLEIAESLPKNERFVSALLYALQIAMRNHSKEKLDALRNGVFATIPPPSYEESLQLQFLQLIDRFTRWHFAFLRVINEPNFMKDHGLGRESTLGYFQKRFPTEFGGSDRTLMELIMADLSTSALIEQWAPRTYSAFGGSPINPRLTDIGRHFLSFISEPGK
jgi:hypothetical protein